MAGRAARLLLCSAFLISAVACGPGADPVDPPSPKEPVWPQQLSNFRFRWSAEPGIALDTGWAVPLRAYLESWLLTYYTADTTMAYPGFGRATPPPLPKGSLQDIETPYALRDLGGYRGKPEFQGEKIVGNEDFRVLRLEPIPNGFRAFVCDSTFEVYRHDEGSSRFMPLRVETAKGAMVDSENMLLRRIEFTEGDARAASPSVMQRGPSPAPKDDVFGPWFVAGSEQVSAWWDADHPGVTIENGKQFLFEARAVEDTMRAQCLQWSGMDSAERERKATTTLDAAPQVEPAAPGWPE